MKRVLNFIKVIFVMVVMLPMWVIRLACAIYKQIASALSLPIILIAGDNIDLPEWWNKIDDATLKMLAD